MTHGLTMSHPLNAPHPFREKSRDEDKPAADRQVELTTLECAHAQVAQAMKDLEPVLRMSKATEDYWWLLRIANTDIERRIERLRQLRDEPERLAILRRTIL